MAATAAETLASSSPKQFELYPNPVAGQLYIRTEAVPAGTQYRILNAYGKAVSSGALTTGPVDVADLPTGVYTLVVSSPGQPTAARRFVK